jgi:hypothetical protein
LKDKALARTISRARFGRGFGPVVRQTAKWMNKGRQETIFEILDSGTSFRSMNATPLTQTF